MCLQINKILSIMKINKCKIYKYFSNEAIKLIVRMMFWCLYTYEMLKDMSIGFTSIFQSAMKDIYQTKRDEINRSLRIK